MNLGILFTVIYNQACSRFASIQNRMENGKTAHFLRQVPLAQRPSRSRVCIFECMAKTWENNGGSYLCRLRRIEGAGGGWMGLKFATPSPKIVSRFSF